MSAVTLHIMKFYDRNTHIHTQTHTTEMMFTPTKHIETETFALVTRWVRGQTCVPSRV